MTVQLQASTGTWNSGSISLIAQPASPKWTGSGQSAPKHWKVLSVPLSYDVVGSEVWQAR